MLTTMSNWEKAAKLDDATRQAATAARALWPELDANEKSQFMERYKATKATKNLGWVRNFKETLTKKKQARRETIEKHFTRHYA